MCTAKCRAALKAGRLLACLPRLHNTMGGSSDTELKLLAVNPTSPCSPRVVTTVTPVVKAPSASRNALPSRGCTFDMVLLRYTRLQSRSETQQCVAVVAGHRCAQALERLMSDGRIHSPGDGPMVVAVNG